jgi:hypothetical protein
MCRRKHGTQAKSVEVAGHQWLTPAILVAQEAEIRKMAVQGQNQQTVL